MTSQQQEHIHRLIREFGAAAYEQYAVACQELDNSGTNPWELTDEMLADGLMNEVLRLWVYAATLRERIKQVAASQTTK